MEFIVQVFKRFLKSFLQEFLWRIFLLHEESKLFRGQILAGRIKKKNKQVWFLVNISSIPTVLFIYTCSFKCVHLDGACHRRMICSQSLHCISSKEPEPDPSNRRRRVVVSLPSGNCQLFQLPVRVRSQDEEDSPARTE